MFRSPLKRLLCGLCLLVTLCAGPAWAKSGTITFASVSWTGVTIKTEVAVKILRVLGYRARNLMVSVPLAYKAMASREADVFLGNWMPSMATIANKYFKNGSVVQYAENMHGAKYTLAVPTFEYKAGLRDFADIKKFADKLDHKIYGIEEGNDGNEIIQKMIDADLFGLKGFTLVASSEAGMLAQVKSLAKEGKWTVFLGWAPHSMNETIDMRYLTGSTEATFGPNDGTANVYTNIRKGFDKKYPNISELLKNLKFPVSMMNQIMVILHANRDEKPLRAALLWLKDHPEAYKTWFTGVTTKGGKPALPVFTAFMNTVH